MLDGSVRDEGEQLGELVRAWVALLELNPALEQVEGQLEQNLVDAHVRRHLPGLAQPGALAATVVEPDARVALEQQLLLPVQHHREEGALLQHPHPFPPLLQHPQRFPEARPHQ